MSKEKEEMDGSNMKEEEYNFRGLRNFKENAPANPMQRELNAVQYHLEATRYQSQKMTDLVETLTKQLIEMTKCALGGEPNLSFEEMEKWTKLVEFESRANRAELQIKELEEQCAKWHEKARIAEAKLT